jgi:hypothetical protein
MKNFQELKKTLKEKNEADCWSVFADLWNQAADKKIARIEFDNGYSINGLCNTVNHFPPHTRYAAEYRLYAKRPWSTKIKSMAYWWSLTAKGSRKRAKFCKKMVKLARRNK